MYTNLSGYQQKMNTYMLLRKQATSELDKYAIAIQTEDSKVVVNLPLGKSGKFAKTIFYNLKASENNVCVVVVTEKLVNQGDKRDESTLFATIRCWRKIHHSVKGLIRNTDTCSM